MFIMSISGFMIRLPRGQIPNGLRSENGQKTIRQNVAEYKFSEIFPGC